MDEKKERKNLHFSSKNSNHQLRAYFLDMGDIHFKTNDGKNCLHIGAFNGHLNFCKVLLDKHKFDFNMADNYGWAALHCSAESGNYELFTYFADKETDIYLKTNDGTNCLHIAALEGNLNLCNLLINKYRFDVNVADKHGWTALHFSAKSGNYELVTYFADMGTDIHLETNYRTNCLHIAAINGHLNLCKILVNKHKFDVNAAVKNGWTALHCSAKSGNYELVTYFADMGTDIHLDTNNGMNCLHIAALKGHLNLCKKLINKHKFDLGMTDNNGWTALHCSAQSGNYELVTYFADKETDIYLKTNDGTNCLHIAALKGNLNICNLLINKYRFDVNVAEKHGWTALHCSAKSGNYELVTYFADMGTDIHLETNDRTNCLHIAAFNGHLNLCKILVNKHKFDVNAAVKNGWTALHCSAKSGNYELVTYFADMGTDIHLETNDRTNCLHIAAFNGHLNLCKILVNKHKFDVNAAVKNGWTALHCSAKSGNYELVTYFADMGTDIHLDTNNGMNCLHIAALKGHLNICKKLINKHKFDLGMTDNNGWTALHCSAQSGNYELFTYFADKETDIYLKTNDGTNCLHIAALEGNLNLCTLLINKYRFDVNVAQKRGWTALHFSAESDDYELVTYFADMGTAIHLGTNVGRNCLHIAALKGHLNLCKKLINKHKFDLGMTDNDGWTALHFSAQSGNYELVIYFANKGTDIYLKTHDGTNCLHIAALEGNLNLCNLLINKYKFDINVAQKLGWTALHCSAQSGNYELFTYFADKETDIYLKTNDGTNCLHIAALEGNLNLCNLLINKYRFDVNVAEKSGWTALHFSAQSGNYELVTYFADMGTAIHLGTNVGRNCLHIAARNGHLNLCKNLINKHKFDLGMTDNDGWTALHCSAQSGNYELVIYFANKGTDIYLKTHDGTNCLHIAALEGNLNLCNLLINKYKFDINVAQKLGWTALHCSAQSGNYELFTYFADKETDIYLKTNDGTNCLHIAARNGHLNLCKNLINKHKFDLGMTDNDGWTALHCSAQSGNYELVIYFANKGTDIYLKTNDGTNCLHIAALEGNLNLCNLLINKYKFDVNVAQKRGWTALHCSAQSGNYELFTYFADKETDIYLKRNDGTNCLHIAALEGNLNLCNLLINKYRFDVNVAGKHGWTALHCSAQSGNYELVTYFADMGTDIHLETNNGMNCLHIAAINGHLNLCKILVNKHKFDVNAAVKNGMTALHCSAKNGNYELVTYFADKETDIYLKTNDGTNCLHIAALEGNLNLCNLLINKYRFDVNVAQKRGWTALHFSAQSGNYELVTYFADMGTAIHLGTNVGRNCLHIAARNGHLNLCKKLINKHKFDLGMTDNDGWTALHFSAQSGNYELVIYLANKGTDIYLKTNDGTNCLHIAALEGNLNLCNLLINKYRFDVNVVQKRGWTALHFSAQSGNYKLFTYFADMGNDIHLEINDRTNCLHIAAFNGHLNLCKILVNKHKFDVNAAVKNGWTALHCSAKSGNYELVTYFADMGTDIHLETNNGMNCLHIAALKGHLNLCKKLINKHKFDFGMTDNNGWAALHCSAQSDNYELFTYFADKETDIYLKTNDGTNCLHIAALEGNLNLCTLLINKYRFDVNVAEKRGWTALHFSAQSGNYELVTYFADMGTAIHLGTNVGRNCLHIAARNGHLNLCKNLINKRKFDLGMTDNDGWTALYCSAQSGNYELVTYFANKGTDIYLKTNDGTNCLHIAALKGNLNLCNLLINKYKFDINVAQKLGWTALHCSAQSGNYELVTYFADMGTDIHLDTNNGMNCLHIAALKGHLNLCKKLINKHKFDLGMTDNSGWTALHCSAQSGNYELFTYFADKETDIHLKTNDGTNCLHIAALQGNLNLCNLLINKYRFDVNVAQKGGWTALHCSAQSGNYELVTYFADMGVDCHLKINGGLNCLHIAALNGHLKLCKYFLKIHNIDVNMEDNDGRTPLHYSASNGSFDVFSYIFRKASEIYCKTNNMENVLHFSAKNGHVNICEFVLKHFTKDYDENNIENQYELIGQSYRSQVFYKYKVIFLHAMDNDGNTYLHLAAVGNHAKVCELLFKYDTEAINLLNKKDKTARDIAQEKCHKDALRVLKEEYDRTGMLSNFFYYTD